MQKELIKGNEAVVKGAIMAGCTHYFGYPITPASEIAHAAAKFLPKIGGTFIQAESEIAAINMVYGAAAAGMRSMTASSGPGISLKQEGISYMAAAELPCVIVDVMRAGPGLGNIFPEQGDYHQVVHGGGHGNYRTYVVAPNSAQEMCDLTMLAFEVADRYRMPAIVLADGYVGQMMEPVTFPRTRRQVERHSWALYGDGPSKDTLVSSIQMSTEALEKLNRDLQAKYEEMEVREVKFEMLECDDAELVFVGYGVVSRILRSAAEQLRAEGKKVGVFRPITLFPFPSQELRQLAEAGKKFLVVELSNGQMLRDVKLATREITPVHFYNRMGGAMTSVAEVVAEAKRYLQGESHE